MTGKTRGLAALARTVEQLADDVAVLTERTTGRIRELPAYANVPVPDLNSSIQRNLDAAVGALRSGVAPTHEDMARIAAITVRERAGQGVPVEDMMRAYRLNIGVIHDRFVELAEALQVPARDILRSARLLWSVGDAFTTRVALEYQELGIDNALRDAHRRSEFLQALLTGAIGPAEMAGSAAVYGLDTSASYLAIRAHVTGDEHIEVIRRRLERGGGTPERGAVVGIVGGDCVGVAARRPGPVTGAVVGVGVAVPLHEVPSSYATASRVLDAVRRLGRDGVLGLDDLSWRLAAVDDPDVGALLAKRYLDPLLEHGDFGDLLEQTMRAYLEHGQNVARTAEHLVVHVNTLRYRLRRFEELTGSSLSSTETIVELAWSLEVGRSRQP